MLLVNERVSFKVENFFDFFFFNLRVSQTILNHNQNLFLIVSACLASLQKFLKGKSNA